LTYREHETGHGSFMNAAGGCETPP